MIMMNEPEYSLHEKKQIFLHFFRLSKHYPCINKPRRTHTHWGRRQQKKLMHINDWLRFINFWIFFLLSLDNIVWPVDLGKIFFQIFLSCFKILITIVLLPGTNNSTNPTTILSQCINKLEIFFFIIHKMN